ncbi:MAG: UDP-N-acetylmuramoyl-L-alanine--D-glutamate ligase [Clostridia bacterium]|nr:UDP-N-acetylmuramoyl-L-alanine--D-glutamate ligase [Clostridia bacterium]
MEYVNGKLIEFNTYLKGRSVALIGLGISNIPLIDYLHDVGAIVTIFERKEAEYIDKYVIDKIVNYGMECYFGEDYLDELDEFDVIFRSPSLLPTNSDLMREARRGAIITTEVEMFIELCPCKVIGVTGSDGKTTTATLIYEILKNAGYNCYFGGNNGNPLFTKIYDIKPDDIVILELSSFQLMNMKISPNISVITSISDTHIKIHSSFEEYVNSIKNVFANQTSEDTLILNYDCEITRDLAIEAPGNVIFYSSKNKIPNGYMIDDNVIKVCKNGLRSHVFDTKKAIIKGMHNYENIAAAIAATKDLTTLDIQTDAISSFEGVPHRLEIAKETPDRIIWYNDSSSEFPSRTKACLNAFPGRDIILIAGGYDKKFDYAELGKEIVRHCKAAILLSQTSDKIAKAIEVALIDGKKDFEIKRCTTLYEAVSIANKMTKKGDIVLFSPASSPLDSFRNYEERGEIFKELVKEIV